MKTRNSKTKGFTLVEIMIVVVIIGLLAAMAIPAFNKVRQNSRRGALINDARQIGAAAQQYLLERSATEVTFSIATTDGSVDGSLAEYVKQVGKGTLSGGVANTTETVVLDGNFSLAHPQVKGGHGNGDSSTLGDPVYFNSEGQLYKSTGEAP